MLGLCTAREDVEDQLGAVDDAGLPSLLEVATLGRRQVVVHDDGVGANTLGFVTDLFHLALAEERGRVRAQTRLNHAFTDDFGVGGFHQGTHFRERATGLSRLPWQDHPAGEEAFLVTLCADRLVELTHAWTDPSTSDTATWRRFSSTRSTAPPAPRTGTCSRWAHQSSSLRSG